ncbi:riboflavin synthase [Weeksellaceae bacterium KMM 9713]|uniref:Riboflavin synthase n=1 Tax=Profundicola chukchiensis TaxID=2961959 RepID=A0A9X4MZN8_9FLAO|nr:riboflavin synthase [Profundicola chukchiensis]MDG4947029.1 riboflavin synthase [Profundicola chukchiensis]
MFTGIVEEMAKVEAIEQDKSNTHYTLSCSFVDELQIDQSVAHDGVCLTVVALTDTTYTVTAIEETLQKTNLNAWEVGKNINLERCIKLNDRLDGHVVQGHVDQVGTVERITDENGSFKIYISYKANTFVTVQKGSICVNGVSLTVVDSDDNGFSIAIIPYTWEHTNLGDLKVGEQVNLEFDILGKYVQKLMEKRS